MCPWCGKETVTGKIILHDGSVWPTSEHSLPSQGKECLGPQVTYHLTTSIPGVW